MTRNRVLLDAAVFMDSRQALSVGGANTADARTIVQRFLGCCYEDYGKSPRFLDGDELGLVLRALLPRRFGVRDPLAAAVEEVLSAYLTFLHETEVVAAVHGKRSEDSAEKNRGKQC